jgi:hypothetical protein
MATKFDYRPGIYAAIDHLHDAFNGVAEGSPTALSINEAVKILRNGLDRDPINAGHDQA